MANTVNESMSSLSFDPHLLPLPLAAAESSPIDDTPHAEAAAEKLTYLDWSQRPSELQEKISEAFLSIAENNTSDWGLYNGGADYGMCGVKEYSLMKKIIQQATLVQRDFYALDIGAGNFQWGEGLAAFINAQPDLPEGITIHIIGIRGEKFTGDRLVQTGRCNIYKLGAFKIEEFLPEFQRQGLDLTNKLDLVVSRWALRHLADPAGTLPQIVCALHREGFLLMDGFYFLLQDQELSGQDFNKNMTRLFLDTQSPFLTRDSTGGMSLNQFVLRKVDGIPCQLPMCYQDLISVDLDYDIGSYCITRFTRRAQPNDLERVGLPYKSLSGDKALYEWFKQNDLFDTKDLPWHPLQEKDVHKMTPRLHAAVLNGNSPEVIDYLENGDDPNESDFSGNTPIHLAIQKKCEEIFLQLLKQKLKLTLQNEAMNTPLHEAAISDTDGRFLQPLLDAGAEVNGDGGYWSPLQRAIKAKNVVAVEILLKAGATVSDENRLALGDLQR